MAQGRDHRRATAQRNDDALLDALEALLDRRAPLSIAGVAAEAGLSRPTVYAHYPTLPALLEAVVERAVRRMTATMDAADPDSGAAIEALDRLVVTVWRRLAGQTAIAQAAAEHLSAEAMHRAHEAARAPLRRLVARGVQDGTIRDDLPAAWLLTVLFALIHAAGDEVRAGRLDSRAAEEHLRVTLHDAFSARA